MAALISHHGEKNGVRDQDFDIFLPDPLPKFQGSALWLGVVSLARLLCNRAGVSVLPKFHPISSHCPMLWVGRTWSLARGLNGFVSFSSTRGCGLLRYRCSDSMASEFTEITEGKATILFPRNGGVFYNPVQEFNRDVR